MTKTPSKKAVSAARRQLREEQRLGYETQRRNAVVSMFDGAGFTIPQIIQWTRGRYPELRDEWKLNEAVVGLIKEGFLVVGEEGYIDRNWERLREKILEQEAFAKAND